MECDDRVDMLSFKTHETHVWPHVNIAKRGSFYVAPRQHQERGRHGRGVQISGAMNI